MTIKILHKITGVLLLTVDDADLRGADLSGADLRDAGWNGAGLRGGGLIVVEFLASALRVAAFRSAEVLLAH